MASELFRLRKALEEMTGEYSKNPSPVLKNRIEYNLKRLHRLEAKNKKKGNNSNKLKIRKTTAT